MNILVVGGTGQIGEAILRALLLKTDHCIKVILRRKPHWWPCSQRIVALDAEEFNRTAYKMALQKTMHIIYCLGKPEQFVINKDVFRSTNIDIMKEFIDEALAVGINSITYISTFEVFRPDANGVIREDSPLIEITGLSEYYKSMLTAYEYLRQLCERRGVALTTLHPSAVYGGLNTGFGVTNYMENIALRRTMRTPFIIGGRFPVIHVDSLADGVIRSIGKTGAFILSDCMTSLGEIARVISRYTGCRVPPTMPLSIAKAGAEALEEIARITLTTPIMSRVQIQYITGGYQPLINKAEHMLGWTPLPLEQGILKYLTDRLQIPIHDTKE